MNHGKWTVETIYWRFRTELGLLHFAWVVDDRKCILVTRVCMCVRMCVSFCLWVSRSLAAYPHYCTYPDVTWRNGRGYPLVVHYWADFQSVPGFRCYDSAEREMSASACTRSMPGWSTMTMTAKGLMRLRATLYLLQYLTIKATECQKVCMKFWTTWNTRWLIDEFCFAFHISERVDQSRFTMPPPCLSRLPLIPHPQLI